MNTIQCLYLNSGLGPSQGCLEYYIIKDNPYFSIMHFEQSLINWRKKLIMKKSPLIQSNKNSHENNEGKKSFYLNPKKIIIIMIVVVVTIGIFLLYFKHAYYQPMPENVTKTPEKKTEKECLNEGKLEYYEVTKNGEKIQFCLCKKLPLKNFLDFINHNNLIYIIVSCILAFQELSRYAFIKYNYSTTQN
ncbi:hypothetical protein BpHYR1_048456 [Brachionus plicatilis]|uniref:Uncharacterized protein n=1 Tax=Brachionus plicatilis TaxID=10195 RepID=A0A3M7PL38_BRAPC|nr:hypothetical protein BpHYR1_048456 [Brachionus plicatilis]